MKSWKDFNGLSNGNVAISDDDLSRNLPNWSESWDKRFAGVSTTIF